MSSKILNEEKIRYYKEREIWWCYLGTNIGSEQNGGKNGLRPVLILRMMSRTTCYIAPLTSSSKRHEFSIPIGVIGSKESKVLISQIRLIDTQRLQKKVMKLDILSFTQIRKAARDLF